MGLVGDSLLEPFWPTGTGCARGFFGGLDLCWLMRAMSAGKGAVMSEKLGVIFSTVRQHFMLQNVGFMLLL